MNLEAIPGFVEANEAYGETTVVVERERIVDAARHCRDELGFNMLVDLTPADYLGWGQRGVAGYYGTSAGRDLNTPMPGSQGLQKLPQPKPARFSVNYHLLSVGPEPKRLRLQLWCEDGDPVESVIPVWPTADWFEREAWDMMGVRIEGHPNMKRLLMDDDWEGHPLRKDYPLGGEPVRFSDAE